MGAIVNLDDRRPLPNPGNGAREAVIQWFAEHFQLPENGIAGDYSVELTDSLLGYLWQDGFKIIPIDSMEDLVSRIRKLNPEELELAKKRARELGLLDELNDTLYMETARAVPLS